MREKIECRKGRQLERHDIEYLLSVARNVRSYMDRYHVSLERAIEGHEPPLSECVAEWIVQQTKEAEERKRADVAFQSLGNAKKALLN